MLQDFFEDFTLQILTSIDDGFGGQEQTWVDGATFRGGISTNTTPEIIIAEKQGLKKIYTLITEISTVLKFDDKVKRNSTGQLYRVTSNSTDMTTPSIAKVKYSQVDLEVFEI